MALEAIRVTVNRGENHVVDADIKGFFDNIDQKQSMDLVAKPVSDRRVQKLLPKWLEAGVMEADGWRESLAAWWTAHELPTRKVALRALLRHGAASTDGDHALPRASRAVKTIRKPCAGRPHARFDRGSCQPDFKVEERNTGTYQ